MPQWTEGEILLTMSGKLVQLNIRVNLLLVFLEKSQWKNGDSLSAMCGELVQWNSREFAHGIT